MRVKLLLFIRDACEYKINKNYLYQSNFKINNNFD